MEGYKLSLNPIRPDEIWFQGAESPERAMLYEKPEQKSYMVAETQEGLLKVQVNPKNERIEVLGSYEV